MGLSLKGMTLTFAALWGGAVLLVGLLNFLVPPYGEEFLRLMASVYPGFSASGAIGDLFIATIYGMLDGAIAGFLLAWLYNHLAAPAHPAS